MEDVRDVSHNFLQYTDVVPDERVLTVFYNSNNLLEYGNQKKNVRLDQVRCAGAHPQY